MKRDGWQRDVDEDRDEELEPPQRGWPGRRTLTMALPRRDRARAEAKPLPGAERARLETELSADLSAVRVHAGSEAAGAADALDARAFAVGTDIYFGTGEYAPHTPHGMHLLAHEVAHTVQQQRGAAGAELPVTAAGEPHELAADRFADAFLAGIGRTAQVSPSSAPAAIARAPKSSRSEPPPTPKQAIRKGASLGGGKITFYPRSVGSSRLGSVEGGTPDAPDRLNAILDQGTTIASLAALLLPLWNDAEPAQPDPTAGEVDVPPQALSADTLARALVSYNAQILAVPKMQNWKPGLRFPLPVRIDGSGNAIVNPHLITALAGGFAPEWAPLLTQAMEAAATPDPADVKTQVAAFLAQQTDAMARGIGLAARALTNARAERPFVVEALQQLSSGALEVALSFMDTVVNSKVEVLSSQADGVAILDAIRAVLAAAPPDQLAAHKDSADRATRMLDRGRGVEVALLQRDWPTVLPHVKRGKNQHITKKKDSDALTVPAVATGKLTDTQQRIVAAIQSARDQLPDPDPKIAEHAYKGDAKAGFMYLGGDDKTKPSSTTSKDPKRAAVMKAIGKEIGREGGWSAVNTYDDAIVTLGAGFTRAMLAQVMQKLFAADPGAEQKFLDVGVTWSGNQALVVNTASGAVEEGDDALQILRANMKIIGMFVTMAEGPEHGQQITDAQNAVLLGTAGNVPQSVVDTWTDMMTVRLVAHLIQWRSSKTWSDYAATGGDVKAILQILIPAAVGKADPTRGGATFLTAEQTRILRSFAEGKAAAAMTGPAALPEDIAKGAYSGHVFFETSGGYYHMTP